MAQAPSPDHQRFCPGGEDGHCFLDRMVGGKPSIRQGSNIFGSHAGIQLDDGAVCRLQKGGHATINRETWKGCGGAVHIIACTARATEAAGFTIDGDRKSTRLNSSHQIISYAVFCLKKKKKNAYTTPT